MHGVRGLCVVILLPLLLPRLYMYTGSVLFPGKFKPTKTSDQGSGSETGQITVPDVFPEGEKGQKPPGGEGGRRGVFAVSAE